MTQTIRAYRVIVLFGGHHNHSSSNFDMTIARIEKDGFKNFIGGNVGVLAYQLHENDDSNLMCIITFDNPTAHGQINNLISDSLG